MALAFHVLPEDIENRMSEKWWVWAKAYFGALKDLKGNKHGTT